MTVDQNLTVPTIISNFVETQFPAFYTQSGPNFIAFVKAYYEWMESSNNPIYFSRNYYGIKDIDTTLDEFIVFFKEKYLKNIQLQTFSDTRQLIKHALDIYRTKGSQRCVELLFQLVFNKKVNFYYPSTDLFKLSDGQWYQPIYLELPLSDNNILLVNKEIYGLTSGATAFVEYIVRRNTDGKGLLQDIAYISAITGKFQVYEKIQPVDKSVVIELCPSIMGSLTEVEINSFGTGQGFSVGDIVSIDGTYGKSATGRVNATANQFGVVIPMMVEGGYGYTNTSPVYVSNVVFTITDINITNTYSTTYFQFLDQFTQPLGYINYINANGIFTTGQEIFTYYSNGSVAGSAYIMNINQTNTSTGIIFVNILSGNVANTFYTSANAIGANLAVSNGFSWSNATGSYIANDASIILTVNSNIGFQIGERINQGPISGTLISISGSNLIVGSVQGTFRVNELIYSNTTFSIANVQNVSIKIGLTNTSGIFVAASNSYVGSNIINGSLLNLNTLGSGITVSSPNEFIYSETVSYNTDLLSTYTGVALNAVSFGFPANSSANLTNTVIGSLMSFANMTIGKITNLPISGFGQNYTIPPFIVADESRVRGFHIHDDIITFSGSTGNFTNGELITQSSTNARGLLKGSNSSTLFLQQLRFDSSTIWSNNQFVLTTNSSTTIIGDLSGVTANVIAIAANTVTEVMGHNADIESMFGTGNGSITSLQIISSGFGFLDGETVIITDDEGNIATGTANLINQGVGSGYYRQKGGFLSDQKKLFDGYFYQNYSYQIISSIMMDKYQDMLNQITHPSGTIMFGQFRWTQENNVDNLSLAAPALLTING